jgi:hypothetical protein
MICIVEVGAFEIAWKILGIKERELTGPGSQLQCSSVPKPGRGTEACMPSAYSTAPRYRLPPPTVPTVLRFYAHVRHEGTPYPMQPSMPRPKALSPLHSPPHLELLPNSCALPTTLPPLANGRREELPY